MYKELILRYWKVIAVIIITLIYYGYAWHLLYENKHLTEENIKLQTQQQTNKGTIDSLNNQISNQNIAIGRLKQEADQNYIKHQTELKQAKEEANRYKLKANELIKIKPQSTNLCDEANKLINNQLQ